MGESEKKGWKGPPGSNRRGGKKGMAKAPGLLIVMRRVLNQPETEDKTDGERQCRIIMKDSPGEFLKQMRELEQDHAKNKARTLVEASKAEAKQAPAVKAREVVTLPPTRDEGTARTVDLIERLLADWSEESRRAGTA